MENTWDSEFTCDHISCNQRDFVQSLLQPSTSSQHPYYKHLLSITHIKAYWKLLLESSNVKHQDALETNCA